MAEGRVVTDRLDSWKEIAAYIGKTERAVMRWEQTRGFPVHRVPGGQRQAVYAWRHEIDAWLDHGDGSMNGTEEPVPPSLADPAEVHPAQPFPRNSLRPRSMRAVWVAAAIAVGAVLATTGFAVHALTSPPRIVVSALTSLTDDN